jgi:protein Tex
VNAVGVDVNMASAPLLRRVSGLSPTIAANIVEHRNQHGAFKTRKDLMKVPRLGDKAFEQAAGFLRIMDGGNPLDASGVHPEAYTVVEQILTVNGKTVQQVIGDSAFLRSLKPADFVSAQFGIPTIKDIIAELEKPGRDPRPEFKSADFMEGVEEIKDLQPGMILEGSVTNVTNFGAFVDIGVHQDGLVHISALSRTFVKDPHTVVKTGDVVKVKVLEVDVQRKRIALTMRLDDPLPAPGESRNESRNDNRNAGSNSRRTEQRTFKTEKAAPQALAQKTGSFGSLLQDAFKKK